MAKYLKIQQRSDAWESARLGLVTASEAKKIITPTGKSSTQWKTYANRLIAEKVLKRQVDFAIADSPWVQRGIELEAEAVLDYELQYDRDTKEIGFVISDNGYIGCSPDRLVGDNGLLELKCPAPQTQIDYLLSGTVEDDYKPQLQAQLYVCNDREWVEIYPYHPELPRLKIQVVRDEVYQKILHRLLIDVNDYIAEGIFKIAELASEMKEPEKKPDFIETLLEDNHG